MRHLTAILAIVLTLLLPPHLHAADAPLLPASAISEQTFVVAQLDVSAVTIDDLKATLKAMLADQASLFDAQMPDIEKLRAGFSAAGGKSLALIANVGPAGLPSDAPIIILNPASPADLPALQSWVADQIKSSSNRSQLTPRDGYLTVTDQPRDLPAASPARHAMLLGKLAQSKAPAQLLLVPSDAMRQAIGEQMQSPQFARTPMAGVAPLLLNAKYLQLSANSGDKPAISMTIEMPDETQAQQLAQIWAGLASLGTQAIIGQFNASGGEAPDPMQLMQALAMKQTGSTLTVSLDTPTLALVAKAAAPALIAARAQAKRAVAMSSMRQLAMSMYLYAADHDNQWPDSLDQLRPYLGTAEQFNKLMTHPTTAVNPGFIYVKPAAKTTDVRNPATTAILFEAGPEGKPDPNGATAFADGHVEAPRRPQATRQTAQPE